MSESSSHHPQLADDVPEGAPSPAEQIDDTDLMRKPDWQLNTPEPEFSDSDRTVISNKAVSVYQSSSGPNPLDHLEGAHFGHLHLKQYLGGGMSAVYRAIDESLARTVAVKILLPHLRSEDYLRRFKNEARNSARLDHENIARVYYVGSFQDLEYIVFEYVDGDNLRQLVEKIGPMALELAIRYTLQIAAALQHAFERDVTHRDVKPSNAIITKGGRVKLVDMGLARYSSPRNHAEDVTSAGVTMGTFDYISPEQARDARSVDVRSDLYSLGCTLFFLLTGNPPYPDGTPIDKILQHSNAQRPDPRVFRSDLPRELSAIVRKLLAPNPDQRYQTPSALINDLLALADREGIPLYGFERAVMAPKRIAKSVIERVLPVLIPVAALIVLLLAVEWFDPPNDLSSSESAASLVNGQPVDPAPVIPHLNSSGSPPTTSAIQQDSPAVASDVKANSVGDTTKTVTSGQPDKVVPPGVIEKCVVGDLATSISDPYVRSFATVDQAFAAIATRQMPAIKSMELRFNGLQSVKPVNLGSTKLDVFAADGYAPVLAFDVADNAELMRLHGGSIRFDQVHFRLQCHADSSTGISLFDIQQPQTLELASCSITVHNVDQQNVRYQNDVAIFRLEAPMDPRMAFPDEIDSMQNPPLIRLTNCIIRGDATMLKAASAIPFVLNFDNGLLVTPDRMIEMGCAEKEPNMVNYAYPEIRLNHVTSVTASGLAQVKMSVSQPYLLLLAIDASNSIFKLGGYAPLVEHSNLDARNFTVERRGMLRITGADSFFSEKNSVWELLGSNGNSTRVSLEDATKREEDWFQQEFPGDISKIQWKSATLTSVKPYHEQLAEDYLLGGGETNTAVRKRAGFDATALPEIPAEASTMVKIVGN